MANQMSTKSKIERVLRADAVSLGWTRGLLQVTLKEPIPGGSVTVWAQVIANRLNRASLTDYDEKSVLKFTVVSTDVHPRWRARISIASPMYD